MFDVKTDMHSCSNCRLSHHHRQAFKRFVILLTLHIFPTVPLGFYPDNVTTIRTGPQIFYPAPGVPFGLSFLGTAFSDFELIGFGYAYEQETKTRLARRAFPAAIPTTQLGDIVGR